VRAEDWILDLKLQGKLALITGGSRGIGKAVGMVLAEEGADVALCAREPRSLEAAAREIAQKTGRRVQAFPADVRSRPAVVTFRGAAARCICGLALFAKR